MTAYPLVPEPKGGSQINFFAYQPFAGSTEVMKDTSGKLMVKEIRSRWDTSGYFLQQMDYRHGQTYWLRTQVTRPPAVSGASWLWVNLQGWDSLRLLFPVSMNPNR